MITIYMSHLSRKPFVIFSLVICIMILNTSCQRERDVVPNEISGEEIFRGVFFLEGELTTIIPALKESSEMINDLKKEGSIKLNKDQESQFNNFRDDLMRSLRLKESGYFSNFKNEMTSGNPYRIQEVIKSCANDI